MCVTGSGVGMKGMKGRFFFKIKTMIDLPKIFSSYVTRKGINEYTNGNT